MGESFDVNNIDEVVHGRVRLGTLAYLSTAGSVEFTELKRRLGTTDGNLATHLRKLEQARYVTIEKTGAGRGSITRVSLTEAGRQAFLGYLDTMMKLVQEMRFPA
jgi:DNA-binding MarR family transcriptional regulator